MNELQTEKAEIASGFLAQHASGNGRRFVGNQARRRRRRRRNGQMNNLFRLKDMRGGYASASGADIEGLGELNEFGTGHISPPEEDGHLQTDARRASGRRNLHEPALFEKVGVQVFSLS